MKKKFYSKNTNRMNRMFKEFRVLNKELQKIFAIKNYEEVPELSERAVIIRKRLDSIMEKVWWKN